jgi:hypothetical protein
MFFYSNWKNKCSDCHYFSCTMNIQIIKNYWDMEIIGNRRKIYFLNCIVNLFQEISISQECWSDDRIIETSCKIFPKRPNYLNDLRPNLIWVRRILKSNTDVWFHLQSGLNLTHDHFLIVYLGPFTHPYRPFFINYEPPFNLSLA